MTLERLFAEAKARGLRIDRRGAVFHIHGRGVDIVTTAPGLIRICDLKPTTLIGWARPLKPARGQQ